MRTFFRLGGRDDDVTAGPLVAPSPYAALATHLGALASETRLELLHALRTPSPLHKIRVGASLSREGERSDRSLSRQAVSRHLDQLLDAGLLNRLPATVPGTGDEFVLNHERLFALVDELRGLSRLRPVTGPPEPGETMDAQVGEVRLAPRPRLMVAYGRDDGATYSLASSGTRWRIGRGAGCDIRLDYDPYLSTEHCALERRGDGFAVEDLGSRNGTFVNGVAVARGAWFPLTSGDLLTAGRSVLAFQP